MSLSRHGTSFICFEKFQLKILRQFQDGVISWSERDRSEEALQYGCIAGNNFVREELAGFLTRQYGEPVDK